MGDDIKTVTLKVLFSIYTDEDGLHYAVRNFSPKFCLSAATAQEAAAKAADALAAYAEMTSKPAEVQP